MNAALKVTSIVLVLHRTEENEKKAIEQFI